LLVAIARNGDAAPAPRETASEYAVKAAYLYHFVQYVTWPSEAFQNRDSPVAVGILGKDPFGDVIDRAFEGRRAMGRRIVVRRVTLAEAARCHVLFMGRENRVTLSRWLDALKSKPVLSVTESPETPASGAAINFVMEGNTVRYEVDMETVAQSGLEIAAPMLVSAKRVLGQEPDSRESR
jgi:hypothetical protein